MHSVGRFMWAVGGLYKHCASQQHHMIEEGIFLTDIKLEEGTPEKGIDIQKIAFNFIHSPCK